MAIDVARTASPSKVRRRLRQQRVDQRPKNHKESRTDAPMMPAMKMAGGLGGSWRTFGADPAMSIIPRTMKMNSANQIKKARQARHFFFQIPLGSSLIFI